MGPDLWGGDDEWAERLVFIEPGEAGGEVAEEAGADGDVVGCRGCFDGDGRHDMTIVS